MSVFIGTMANGLIILLVSVGFSVNDESIVK